MNSFFSNSFRSIQSPRVYLPILIILMVVLWMLSKTSDNQHQQNLTKTLQTSEASQKLQKVLFQIVQNKNVMKTLTLQGEIMPKRAVNIKTETSGKIENVLVERGQKVQKGDILLVIEKNEKQLKYEQAQAELDSVLVDYNANDKLVAQGAKSKNQFEATKANLSRAKVNLENAKLELSRTTIKAPFDGIIETKLPEIGHLLSPGESVTTVIDVENLLIFAVIPQIYAKDISLDTKGVAVLINGEKVNGKITNISPSSKNASRTFNVEFTLDSNDKHPLIGSSTRLILDIKSIYAAEISPSIVFLPSPKTAGDSDDSDDSGDSLINNKTLLLVKTITAENLVKYINVERVKTSVNNLVVSGIEDGTKLITRGAGYVVENEQVDAIQESAKTEKSDAPNKEVSE